MQMPGQVPGQITGQVPAQMGMAACGHHLSMQRSTGHDRRSHSQCCKCATCSCAQLPALMTSLPTVVSFVPIGESSSIPALISLASPPAKFFRPPI